MPINLNQDDLGFRPLDNFLFKCAFLDDPNVKNNLTPEILKKLEYSVSKVTLPKMKESDPKPHLLGSFAIQFPYFSTGEKEMSIEFYETDDMLVSKVFYSFLNRYRWKASTIFDISHADLMIRVTLLDQRNKNGMAAKHPRRLVYEREYWIKTISIDPPQFTRDGSDTDLCTVTVNFNTIESKYNNIVNDTFGSADEINAGAKDDNAFTDTNAVGEKLFEMFEGLMGDPVYNTPSGIPDKTSQYKNRKEFANSLGVNSVERLAVLSTNPNKITELRKFLQQEGVDVNDYSAVNDALREMGIFGNAPNGFCQRGVSVLEAVVTGDKRVQAPTASSSIEAWKADGYDVTEEKKFYKRNDVENYIKKLIDEGKLKEGDKIVIDYDSEGKTAGHIITVLKDDNPNGENYKGWYTSSDGYQRSLTGLGMNHKVSGMKVLTKSEDRLLLEQSKNVSAIGNENKPKPEKNENDTHLADTYKEKPKKEEPKKEEPKPEIKPPEVKPQFLPEQTSDDTSMLDGLGGKKDLQDILEGLGGKKDLRENR